MDLHEGIGQTPYPALESDGRFEYGEAQAIRVLCRHRPVYVFGSTYQKIPGSVAAIVIGETAVDDDRDFCTTMPVLKNLAARRNMLQGHLTRRITKPQTRGAK